VAPQLHDRLGLIDARVHHLLLHQVAGKNPGNAQAEQGDANKNAELGGDLQIAQFHGMAPATKGYGCARESIEIKSTFSVAPLSNLLRRLRSRPDRRPKTGKYPSYRTTSNCT